MSRSVNEPNLTPAASTQPNIRLSIFSRAFGSPALGTATAAHAAVADSGADQTISTAITQPDVPRNVTATTTGTGANVTAVSVVVTGTDIEGAALTETLPAFAAGSNNTATGVKAFATITSYVQPACGASVNISLGRGTKLGLPRRLTRDTVLAGYLAGVREATRPTATFDGTDLSKNTVTLSSALNATAVLVDFVDA